MTSHATVGHLLVDQRDRDGEFGLGEGRGQHADDDQLPESLDEERHAREQRSRGEADHPHPLAPERIHPVADEERHYELRGRDEKHEGADERARQLQLSRDVRARQDQQIQIIGGERPARQRYDYEVDGVPAADLFRAPVVPRISCGLHGALYSGTSAIARPGPPEDSAILTGMKMK